MSFLDDFSRAVGHVVQGTVDFGLGGPAAIAARQQLEALEAQQNLAILQYRGSAAGARAWVDPLNDCAKLTSSLLHQSSDFIHGIAVSYRSVIESVDADLPRIQGLDLSSAVVPLLQLPTVPGISLLPDPIIGAAEQMVAGAVNLVTDSMTLGAQIVKVTGNIATVHEATAQVQQVDGRCAVASNYLLTVANQAVSVFRAAFSLTDLPSFSANSPTGLTQQAAALQDTLTRLGAVRGNAFRVVRALLDLANAGHLSSDPSEAELDVLARKLFAIDDFARAFGSVDAIRTFVNAFVHGDSLSPGSLLHLPPVPAGLGDLLHETPPASDGFSDIGAPEYDPPDITFP